MATDCGSRPSGPRTATTMVAGRDNQRPQIRVRHRCWDIPPVSSGETSKRDSSILSTGNGDYGDPRSVARQAERRSGVPTTWETCENILCMCSDRRDGFGHNRMRCPARCLYIASSCILCKCSLSAMRVMKLRCNVIGDCPAPHPLITLVRCPWRRQRPPTLYAGQPVLVLSGWRTGGDRLMRCGQCVWSMRSARNATCRRGRDHQPDAIGQR